MYAKTLRSAERRPTHPGALLRDIVLPALENVTKVEVAQALDVSRQTLYDILKETQPVTPQMAVRLSRVFGTSADVWLGMQSAYDLWTASREVDVSKLHVLKTVKPRETV
jgi:addiction module HigA family antidote